jgi:hypothetical protein
MRREYTAEEAQELFKADEQLRKNGLDSWTQEGSRHNADLLDAYFQSNPTVPVTVANVYKAIEARKQEFKWLSLVQARWFQIAQDDISKADQLANWFAAQHQQPGQLVNSGDGLFVNLALLFEKLRGYEINATTISHAIDRVQNNPGPKLHYIETPRRTEPQSHAAKNDDGIGFLHSNMVQNADGSWRSKNVAEQRADMAAAEGAKQPDLASAQSLAVAEAQRKAEEIRGNSHAESEQIQRIFITEGSEINWPATYQARIQMQRQFQKHREIARFIR